MRALHTGLGVHQNHEKQPVGLIIRPTLLYLGKIGLSKNGECMKICHKMWHILYRKRKRKSEHAPRHLFKLRPAAA